MYDVFRALKYGGGGGHPGDVPPPGAGDAGRSARLTVLEERFEKLLMVCQAQWALLQETSGLTEDELHAKLREIDLSDGLLDGKVRVPVVECPQCGRKVGQRHERCLYCGAERDDDHPFRI
jgi:hypothetical protein